MEADSPEIKDTDIEFKKNMMIFVKDIHENVLRESERKLTIYTTLFTTIVVAISSSLIGAGWSAYFQAGISPGEKALYGAIAIGSIAILIGSLMGFIILYSEPKLKKIREDLSVQFIEIFSKIIEVSPKDFIKATKETFHIAGLDDVIDYSDLDKLLDPEKDNDMVVSSSEDKESKNQ